MKNKFFAILILALLSLPVSVWAVDNYAEVGVNEGINQGVNQGVEVTQGVSESTGDETASVAQEAPQEVQDLPTTPYKQPVSKKKIVVKFLAAMLGVGISSVTIYVGLTLYNKVREGFVGEIHTPEGETPLNTPEKMEDAVKTFLDKTKWI